MNPESKTDILIPKTSSPEPKTAILVPQIAIQLPKTANQVSKTDILVLVIYIAILKLNILD